MAASAVKPTRIAICRRKFLVMGVLHQGFYVGSIPADVKQKIALLVDRLAGK
jgi:hypothetical protein